MPARSMGWWHSRQSMAGSSGKHLSKDALSGWRWPMRHCLSVPTRATFTVFVQGKKENTHSPGPNGKTVCQVRPRPTQSPFPGDRCCSLMAQIRRLSAGGPLRPFRQSLNTGSPRAAGRLSTPSPKKSISPGWKIWNTNGFITTPFQNRAMALESDRVRLPATPFSITALLQWREQRLRKMRAAIYRPNRSYKTFCPNRE